jgi:hypothetical protein
VFAAHRVVPPGTSGGDFIDREGVVAKRYGSAPTAYLIRPDGYVGFRGDGRTLSADLPHYLARLFSSAGVGRGAGSAPVPDAGSEELLDSAGAGARHCAIEGPVTTSKSL